jgi:hypothetical protein
MLTIFFHLLEFLVEHYLLGKVEVLVQIYLQDWKIHYLHQVGHQSDMEVLFKQLLFNDQTSHWGLKPILTIIFHLLVFLMEHYSLDVQGDLVLLVLPKQILHLQLELSRVKRI